MFIHHLNIILLTVHTLVARHILVLAGWWFSAPDRPEIVAGAAAEEGHKNRTRVKEMHNLIE